MSDERTPAGFWETRWNEGRIAFHRHDPSPELREHTWFLEGGPHTVLMPLCGKSVDMAWLRAQGHQVIGVELVPLALRQFLAEHAIDATETAGPHGTRFEAPGLVLHAADWFAIAPTLPMVTRIWDRAALIALPPAMRDAYVAHLRRWLDAGALMLLSTVAYDPAVMPGPPFSVDPDEVRRHYNTFGVEHLRDADGLAPRWREVGHTWMRDHTFRIGR